MPLKRITVLIVLAILMFVYGCSRTSTEPPVTSTLGDVNLNIQLSNVGSLSKTSIIDLENVYIELSSGTATILDTVAVSGNSQVIVNKSYTGLVDGTWSAIAESRDVHNVVIHSDSTTFTVTPNSSIDVSLSLTSKYSMLIANFVGIADSVSRCELLVDAALVADSSFAAQSAIGSTLSLDYDYLGTGVDHAIKLDAYGDMWGSEYLLYTGDTTISVVAGADNSYSVNLEWVGPDVAPSGTAVVEITIGPTGTLTVNGTFEAAAETVTDIDGNIYSTVTIGNQVWMAENLKVTHYRDGTAIPNVTVGTAWAALTTGAYCIYNNNAANEVDSYGSLYNWYAVSDSRNIAPQGWHVPTDDEWKELFDGPWPTITMAEHYEQMSYGQFHLSGNVYGWYELSHESSFYEGNDNGFSGPPGGTGDFLRESLDQADLEVDFSQYDSDGPDGVPNSGDDDGYVDAAFFVHSGRGGEGGGPSIWSHRWVYSAASGTGAPYSTNDTGISGQPIKVQDYIMQPAVAGGSQGTGGLIQIGVFSHEFGHALGLPDLYDTDYSSDGVGSWCLMASGSWSSPSSPVHFSAWCKEMLGWTIPIIPNQNTENFEFPNAEENSFVVKLWTHGELDPFIGNYSHGQDVGQEYYLIENRQRLGSEEHLPGTGLVIWHIDNSRSNNNNENHRMVDVKAADGYFNGSNSGDSWPGYTDNRNFDFETTPTSIGWAGINTEVAVRNISDSDTTMWADIEVYESNPHIRIIDMLVSDFNGDNIYAPGENVLIWLIVENTGALANNATATLSIEGNAVELIDDTIGFNPIGFQETSTSNQGFQFNISYTLSPGPVSFEVSFSSDELTQPNLQQFELLLGLPEIVLVDDDGALSGSSDYQAYFTDALKARDLVHVVWDIGEQDLPDLDWLADFTSVIWFSGDNPVPLNAASTTLIANYLDGGGNILMTGQNMASGDVTVQTLLRDYFSAELLTDDIITPNVYGDPGHEFFDINDRYAIANSAGAHNQFSSDSYAVLDGGSSMFMYPFLGGASAGVSVKNQTYSAVMLGFGLEALTHFGGATDTSRGQVIDRLLQWMKTPATSIVENTVVMPVQQGICASYPNPFNPSINFDIQMSAGDRGTLQILDIRGSLVETTMIDRSGSIRWTPSVNVAGGVYFARFMMHGKTVGSLTKITYLK